MFAVIIYNVTGSHLALSGIRALMDDLAHTKITVNSILVNFRGYIQRFMK